MSEPTRNFAEESAAFQKIWLESMTRLMQAACLFPPDSAPPELIREIRNGILRALGETWNEFLRSPQFQENMKQWMDSAIAFRKLSNNFMVRVRKEMQAPSRDDIDTILLNVRHMETRILDRMEELSDRIEELSERSAAANSSSGGSAAAGRDSPARNAPRRRTGKKTNQSRSP